MTAKVRSEAQVEIGHVLFMDIVGFSKLLGDEQSDISHRLNQIVRNTESFRVADATGQLIRLPTGDGMALVFFTGPESPVQCAVEISRDLKSSIPLRIGIHSGPVDKTIDVDGRSNVTGSGINMAQRLMDCGDAGHILLSKRIAEDLSQYGKWRPHLHELGEAEVKHGTRIDVFNFYTEEVGKPALPQRIKEKPTAVTPHSRKILVGTGVLGAIVLAAGAWLVTSHLQQKLAASAGAVPEKSVAIFPFKPLSSQNRDEVLENGMADSLIVKLSTIREIIIPALTSARKYDEQEHDLLAAGRLLHVRAVLEGTLQKVADRIRVTARLISVADGASMWTGTFDEKFTDVFAVQDNIATKVAEALVPKLSGEQQNRLTKHYTQNTEAYQLYLKGRFYWNKYTPEAWRKSIDYFKQALEQDPNYALAYAGLADTHSLMSELGALTPDEGFPKARSYAETALKLDDSLADAHLSLGIVKLFYEEEAQDAERELSRAKELNPNNPQAYHFYSHYLQFVGRVDDAVAEIDRGAALDPTNLIVSFEQANARYFARKFQDSIAYGRKTLELDPNFSFISVAIATDYEMLGQYNEALAELERTRAANTGDPQWQGQLARIYVKLNRRAEAEQLVRQLEQNLDKQFFSALPLSWAYLALGDHDRAIAALNHDCQHHLGVGWAAVDPVFDPIRSDPRFAAVLNCNKGKPAH